MRRGFGRQRTVLLAGFAVGFAVPLAAPAATITGAVIGEGGRPIAGAAVQVVRDAGDTECETQTAADGTFSLSCAATGRHTVRASSGDLRPWEIDDVVLEPGAEVYLNFLLMPATATIPANAPSGTPDQVGFWTRRLPNPVLATWGDRPLSLRLLAIGVAVASFPLGVLVMLGLGRRFGVQSRRLSAGEVGDLVLNPQMPSAGERVTPVGVVGARGAAATVTYGADEIAAALSAGRYGLVFVALVIAPGLFALFAAALAVAMLIGQETYLLCAMLLVPAGFVLTPLVIGTQALRRRQQPDRELRDRSGL